MTQSGEEAVNPGGLGELVEDLEAAIDEGSIELGRQWVLWIRGVLTILSEPSEQGFRVSTNTIRLDPPAKTRIVLRASEVYRTVMGLDIHNRFQELTVQDELEPDSVVEIDYLQIIAPKLPQDELTAVAFSRKRYHERGTVEGDNEVYYERDRYVFNLDNNLIALVDGTRFPRELGSYM